MRAALTGANGFLGTYISYYLLKNGHEVVGLRREESSLEMSRKIFELLNELENSSVDFGHISWVIGDVTDPYSLENLLEGITVVFHTAAVVSFEKKLGDELMLVNVDGTANVVNAACAKGVKKLVLASSVAALTNIDNQPVVNESFHNTTFYRFENLYGESKYRAEMEAWRGMAEGLEVVALNPSVIIGAWKFENSSVAMFKSVNKGLSFYPSGIGSFVDVRDVASAMINAAESDGLSGERFIISGASLPFKDFLQNIAVHLGVKKPSIKAGKVLSVWVARMMQLTSALMGKSAPFTPAMARAANRQFSYNTTKSQEQLGITYRPIQDTIKWTADFFLKTSS